MQKPPVAPTNTPATQVPDSNLLATQKSLRASSRWLIIVAWGILAAALIAILQLQTAVEQRDTAEVRRQEAVAAQSTAVAEREIARTQALAANARASFDTDPELGVLLAAESISPTLQGGDSAPLLLSKPYTMRLAAGISIERFLLRPR
jgi:hypothetical protein